MRKKTFTLMLLGAACALSVSAQSVQEEKAFIKENMEFAAQQYGLMMKTPGQGKEGKGVMPHSMRKDGSFYHIAMYDPKTGDFIKGETSQGYSDNSAWSRGQGWAIYGFTVCYRETGDKRFLSTAEKAADFYINHPNLPADKVAWWDFNAHQEGFTPGIRSNARKLTSNYRDASAAALTASALFELSGYVKGKKSELYFETAKQIIHALGSEKYRAKLGENANFVLMHSTGAIPQNSEIDVPLTYAYYYFIEALHRYNLLLDGKPLF